VSGPARWISSGSLARPPTGARSEPVVKRRKARFWSREKACSTSQNQRTWG
jgi:hypothetical protein